MVEKLMTRIQKCVLFIVIGLILYGGVYYTADRLAYKNGRLNSFHKVKTTKQSGFDYVILGASHALPFGFEDMNATLEGLTGTRIINLAGPGHGIIPNIIVFEYFLKYHQTKNVLYVLDTFALSSKKWNEERLEDVKLLQWAPFDLTLARMLLDYSFEKGINKKVPLDYITGFSKINNHSRLEPETFDGEKKFGKKYRFFKPRDKQRIKYLYGSEKSDALFGTYMAIFMDWIETIKMNNIGVIVIKTPIPTHIYEMLPQENEFNRKIQKVLMEEKIPFYDFSLINNEKEFFYDTDHLNSKGVDEFFTNHLKDVLKRHVAPKKG